MQSPVQTIRPIQSFRTLLTALLLALSAITANAQTADLSWKWTPGTTSTYRLVERMLQTISGPSPAELTWQRTLTFTQSITEDDAAAVVSRTFDTVAVTVEGRTPDPIRYDSADPATEPNADHPLIAPFARMLNKTLRVRLDPEGNVTAVEGNDDLLKAMLGPLEQSAPDLTALLRKTTDPTRCAVEQTQAALDLIPNRRIRRGESWSVTVPNALPLVAGLDTKLTATLDRLRRGAASISLEGNLTQSDTESTSPVLELRRAAITGQIEFNVERGQIDRQSIKIDSAWSTSKDLTDALGIDPTEQTLRQTAELTRLP